MASKPEVLQRLQNEGYFSVCRALAGSGMTWDRESLLAKLRKEFNISDAMHKEVLDKVDNDAEVTAIKQGQPLPSAMQDVSAGMQRAVLPVPAPRRSGGQAPARSAGRGGARPPSPTRASSASMSDGDFVQDSDDSGSTGPRRRGGGRTRNRYRVRQRDRTGGARVQQQQQQQQQSQQQQQLHSGSGRSHSMVAGIVAVVAAPSTARRRASKARVEHLSEADDSGYVGLALWRHWPKEPTGWVKGVITDFKGDTNEHTITYGMHTPGQESWEDFDFTAAVQGEDYVLAGPADELLLDSAARGLKRKMSALEQLPYDAGTLQQRLSGSNAAELQDMHEALMQRAREITCELISLDAPEAEYPDPVQRVQRLIRAATEREGSIRTALQHLTAA